MVRIVHCPQCGKEVPWLETQKWRPFCCERCKLIDLGEWAAEGHKIAGDPVNTDTDTESFNPADYH